MNKLLIIAHRGASQYEEDNSLPAIQLAIEQGADIVEIDVRATKDQVLVLRHDDRFKRLDSKHKVSNMTYQEITDRGIVLPILKEVIKKIPPHIKLNLDLKSPNMDLALKALIDADPNLEERIFFDSPNPFVLQRYHLFFPKSKTVFNSSFQHDPLNLSSSFLGRIGLATLPMLFSYPYRKLFRRQSLKTYPHFVSVMPRLCKQQDVDFYHSLGIGVFVAVVNKEKNMHKFIALGVDGIKTDRPDLLFSLLHA